MRLGVPLRYLSVGIHTHQHRGHRVDDVGEIVAQVAEFLFCPLALGDVPDPRNDALSIIMQVEGCGRPHGLILYLEGILKSLSLTHPPYFLYGLSIELVDLGRHHVCKSFAQKLLWGNI